MRKQTWTFLGVLLLIGAAWADSWASPEVEEYSSPNGTWTLKVTPGEATGEKAASGELRNSETREILWTQNLKQHWSPVSAIVADDGKHVATFDNWGSVGFGENVVVLHDDSGKVVRSYSLEDIYHEEEIQAIGRSVSSRWWGGKHLFNSEHLVLSCVTGSAGAEGRDGIQTTWIRRDDGEIVARHYRNTWFSRDTGKEQNPAAIELIRSEDELKAFRKLVHQGDSSGRIQVDFKSQAILAIFWGEKPNNGYAPSLEAFGYDDRSANITVFTQPPKDGYAYGDEVIDPHLIMVIPKRNTVNITLTGERCKAGWWDDFANVECNSVILKDSRPSK